MGTYDRSIPWLLGNTIPTRYVVLIVLHGSVAEIYTVGRSATGVKLKVNGQVKIFSKVNSKATLSL